VHEKKYQGQVLQGPDSDTGLMKMHVDYVKSSWVVRMDGAEERRLERVAPPQPAAEEPFAITFRAPASGKFSMDVTTDPAGNLTITLIPAVRRLGVREPISVELAATSETIAILVEFEEGNPALTPLFLRQFFTDAELDAIEESVTGVTPARSGTEDGEGVLARNQDLANLKGRFKARYPTLLRLKDEGLIGEAADGSIDAVKETYLDRAGTPNQTVREFVAVVNTDRTRVYELMAKSARMTKSKVAERAAQRNFEKSAASHFLRLADESWVRKRDYRPDTDRPL
jgi:uncharacterized protein YdbL (DUF1318 family)